LEVREVVELGDDRARIRGRGAHLTAVNRSHLILERTVVDDEASGNGPEGILGRGLGEGPDSLAHQVGERIQALIMEVRDTPSAIKIILKP
jgi:hypothetical protein